MTTFLLIRHADTGLKGDEQFFESKLSLKGLKQAKKLADKLKGCQASALYASPYRRTVQTAEIVAKELNQSIVCDERLGEIILWSEVEDLEAYPAEGVTLRTFNDYQQKRLAFLEELGRKHCGRILILVCHGNLIRAFLGVALKMAPEVLVRFYINCASITTLDQEENGLFKLGTLNYICHLEGL